MEFSELKTKSPAELQTLLAEQRAQLHSLKLQAHSHQLKQVHRLSPIRQTVARILTVLRQQKIA